MVADIDLILNAFAAGAGGFATAMAGDGGRKAYEKLKDLLLVRLEGRPVALRELEADEPRREVLQEHLVAAGAEADRVLVETAQELLRHLGPQVRPMAPGIGGATAARDAFTTVVHGGVVVHGGWNLGGGAADRSEDGSGSGSGSGEVNLPPAPAAV